MSDKNFWMHTRSAREDLAFTAFVLHQDELDDIVNRICNGELHILASNWLSGDDLLYIEREVEKRLGCSCDLSL